MEFGVLSFLTPLVAIVMALLTRNVIAALIIGSLVGELVIHHFSFMESISSISSRFTSLLSEVWILKTLAFALLVGSIVRLLQMSGAVESLIEYLQERHKLITSEKRALLLAYVIGVVIFVESSITSLVAGTITRPFIDKLGVPRAKLAYVCDSTSAPVCSILLLNGWGALLLGLISTSMSTEGDAITLLIESVAYNFYAFFALIVTFFVIYFSLYTLSMQKSQIYSYKRVEIAGKDVPISFLYLPLFVLIVSVLLFLYITGSGSSSILYGVLLTLFVMYLQYRKSMSLKHYFLYTFEGIKNMVLITFVLFLAFYIGSVTNDLHTGEYLSSLLNGAINREYIPALIFLIAALIAFSTGTSWGTFSIMTPIAFALATDMDLNIALCMGAVISGGVFGDHSSVISDTTIISSMASGCDTVEHVKTQLPYALFAALLSAVAFFIAG